MDAYSYNTGEKMVSYSDEQIKSRLLKISQASITILAPVIRARKDIMEIVPTNRKARVLKVV
jgi:hypothetical protein